MKKLCLGIAVLLAFGMMASVAVAGVGNQLPSGPHYNLNIIGAKDKNDVGDSMGHTLFVKEEGKTKILMTQDPDGVFQVVDRDGTDGTAEFNIAPGYYLVFARALGKPGEQEYDVYVHIDAKGRFAVTDENGEPIYFYVDDQGNEVILLGAIDISRLKGKPETRDLNPLFYVTVDLYEPGADPEVDDPVASYVNEWVFDIEELYEYFWEYNNSNLKLLQVRFYPVDENPFQAPSASNPTITWGEIKK